MTAHLLLGAALLIFVPLAVLVGGGALARRLDTAPPRVHMRAGIEPEAGLYDADGHHAIVSRDNGAAADNDAYAHRLAAGAWRGLGAPVGDSCSVGSANGGGPLNCGGGCSQAIPAAEWWLADQIPTSRAFAGANINVNLRGLQPRTQAGYAHVIGVRLKGTVRFVVSNAVSGAVTGYDQMGAAFGEIFAEDVAGWQYLAGVNARDLIDDRYLRSFTQRTTLSDFMPADIAANVGVGNVDVPVELYWPLTRPWARGHEALLDSVPLALLQARGDSALRFTVPSSIPGAPVAVAAGGFIDTVEVLLHLAYLPQMFIDRPFQIETYVDANLSGNALRCERTSEYVTVRPYPEDNGGQYANDFGTATFSAAGDTIASGLTLAQQVERTKAMIADDPRYTDAVPALFNPNNDGSMRFIFVTGPVPKARPAMASGVIGYNWTSRTRTFTRFLQRSIDCHMAKRLNALGGVDKVGYGVEPDGTLSTTMDKMKPVLLAQKG